jgi:FKBP-type peptidyl-prolyl cis-trans isomerase FkpA
MKKIVYLTFCLLLWVSCSKEENTFRDEILRYLTDRQYEYTDTLGIWMVVQDSGSIEKPIESSLVSLEYKGQYLDNEVFDATGAFPSEIKLSSAIPGLKNGIKLLGKNARALIIIPPDQAYGNNPPWGVRKNAVLVYDIHLVDFR